MVALQLFTINYITTYFGLEYICVYKNVSFSDQQGARMKTCSIQQSVNVTG